MDETTVATVAEPSTEPAAPTVPDTSSRVIGVRHPLLDEPDADEAAPTADGSSAAAPAPTPEPPPADGEKASGGDSQAEPPADVPAWRKALEEDESLDPSDILNHPKIRSAYQSAKDREIAAVVQKELARRQGEWEARERERIAREAAEAERARLESLSDEEWGREVRSRHQLDEWQQRVERQALQRVYEQDYTALFAKMDAETIEEIKQRAQQEGWTEFAQIAGAAMDTWASRKAAQQIAEVEKQIDQRAEAKAEELYKKRIAALHLNEPAPDRGTALTAAGQRRIPASEFNSWGALELRDPAKAKLVDEINRNPNLVDWSR